MRNSPGKCWKARCTANGSIALPMPIFFALSGTLVYDWFARFDEGAAIAANFLVSSSC